jgi:hypothetical protein
MLVPSCWNKDESQQVRHSLLYKPNVLLVLLTKLVDAFKYIWNSSAGGELVQEHGHNDVIS